MSGKASWGFREGDEIAPGRTALAHLGGGKRYETYLAWEERLLVPVVVKLVRPDATGDERARARLAREAGILRRLAHPVILRVLVEAFDGDRPHLVLEHLEGPTLRSLVKRHGPLAVEQAVPLAQSLAAALHYLRAEGVVHLDVKPGNVIMGAPPRLIDFGIARTVEDAARIARPLGTGVYMAPEQCDPVGRGPVGPPADAWGLGATLYEAIAGRPPFPKAGGEHAQLTAEPEALPRNVPGALAETVMALLAKEAGARPAPAEVAAALEPLLALAPKRVLRRRRPRF